MSTLNYLLLHLVALVLILSGCQTDNARKTEPLEHLSNPSLFTIDSENNQQIDLRLKNLVESIRKYALRDNWREVILALATLNSIGGTDKAHRSLGLIFLEYNRLNLAQKTLLKILAPNTDDILVLAKICTLLADHRCVARNYMNIAAAKPANAPKDSELNTLIWNNLVSTRDTFNPISDYEIQWLTLANIFSGSNSITEKITGLEKWKTANKIHPAAAHPPEMLKLLSSFEAPKLSVILPLSGKLKSVGAVARDGIIASYLKEDHSIRGYINFYDSQSTPLEMILEEIRKNDTDVVIGPLLKEKAEKFIKLSKNEKFTTLLLNYLENSGDKGTNQYSLGLSIEDEIKSLVAAMIAETHENVLIINNNEPWALRSRLFFQERWSNESTFASFEESSEMTTSIGTAIGAKTSVEREKIISRLITQPVEFLPRSRQDIDAVLALISPLEASSLESILKFYFLEDLPVFSSSLSASVVQEKQHFLKRGVEFPFNTKNEKLKSQFGLTSKLDHEIFALGLDAYSLARLIPFIKRAPSFIMHGEIGQLQLEANNTFRRELLVKSSNNF